MKRAILAFLLLAGDLAPARENPAKHLRLIALGEDPRTEEPLPYRHLRHDPAVAEGLMIPGITALVSGDQSIPFEMTLGNFTKILPLDGTAEKLEVASGKGRAAKSWVSAPMPTAPLSLAVLYQDPEKMIWKKPKLLLLADDSKAFPPGSVRFVNVSEKTILVKLGDKAFGISPGKSMIKPAPVGTPPFLLGYIEKKGSQRLIHDNQIEVLENQRMQCFFYKARKPEKGGPVRFCLIPEEIPIPAAGAK